MTDFDALWDYDDPAGTERVFRDVLAREGAKLANPRKAELLSQIARTLGLQRRFDEAHALLDEAFSLAANDDRARARCLLERGRALNSGGRRPESVALFHEAAAAADRAGADDFAVDALHMLAIVSPPDESMRWHRAGIERARASADAKARNWLGSLYNNLGWSLHAGGSFDEALRAFEDALQARVVEGAAAKIRIARWCIARAKRSLGRVEEALAEQTALHEECERIGERDGFGCEEIGECLLALGRGVDARPHFARAHELLSRDAWLVEAEPQRIERLRRLGESGVASSE